MTSRPLSAARCVAALLALSALALAHTPHDKVFVVGVSPGFAQDGSLLIVMQMSEHSVIGRSFDGGRSWQTFGSELAREAVTELRLSPNYAVDGIAFCGTSRAGLWRSTDFGETWTSLAASIPAIGIEDLEISPDFAVDQTLLVATDMGLFISTDQGDNFTPSTVGLTETNITALAVTQLPGGELRLYAGRNVLHVSSDSGDTWQSLGPMAGTLRDIELSPDVLSSGKLAITFAQGGLWRSNTGGASFPPELSELPGTRLNDLKIGENGRIFACSALAAHLTSSFEAPLTIASAVGLDPLSDQTADHYQQLGLGALAGGGELLFMAGFEGLFRSTDPSDRWRGSDVYPQLVNRALVISPTFAQDSTLAIGNFGGGLVLGTQTRKGLELNALTTTAGPPTGTPGVGAGSGAGAGSGGSGAVKPIGTFEGPEELAWSAHGDNITSLWTGPLSVSPDYVNDGTIMIGHVGLWVTNNRGHTWTKSPTPAGVSVVRGVAMSPDFANDQVAFFGTASFGPGQPNQGYFKTTDGGQSWVLSDTGIDPLTKSREFGFSPTWAIDQTVFVSSRNMGVHRSTDGGATWQEVNNGLLHQALRVFRVSPDFINDQTLFAGSTKGGLYMSTDAGDTWVQRNAGLPDFGGIDIEGIAVSPNYAIDQTVYIVSQRSGVWVSHDRALSWTPVNDGLPLDMPRNLEISPDFVNDQTLFLSTHDWVWRSENAGGHWERLPGLLRVPDEHPQLFYKSPWQRVSLDDTHGKAISQSNEPGQWFEFEFRGKSISWLANRGPDGGQVRVTLDGELVGLIDTYAPTEEIQRRLFSEDLDDGGWHTIRMTVHTAKNRLSTDTLIRSDGFEYSF